MGENDRKDAGHEIILDDNAILEALIYYVQERHDSGRVVDVEWLLEPEQGYELPPIKGISVRCTLSGTKAKKVDKKAREKAITRWEGEGGALLPKESKKKANKK